MMTLCIKEKRNRYLISSLIIIIITCGLYSRSAYPLPSFLKEYAGDALWSAMVYMLLLWIKPDIKVRYAFMFSLGFSFFIEISQLWETPFLLYLRGTFLRYLLGQGFVYSDFVCYSVGALCISCMDASYLFMRKRKG